MTKPIDQLRKVSDGIDDVAIARGVPFGGSAFGADRDVIAAALGERLGDGKIFSDHHDRRFPRVVPRNQNASRRNSRLVVQWMGVCLNCD